MTSAHTGSAPSDPEASETSEAPARGSLGLLRDRTFGPYFAGKLMSTIGVWIHNVAAAILVWDLTRSTFMVGAVSVGQFLPQMLLAPWSGAQADRGDRRRQLIIGRVITVVGSGGLAAWIVGFGVEGTSGAVVVICASTLVGVGFAVGLPAMNALVPALVRPHELPGAIALGALPMTVARSVGPALGALLLYSSGAASAFAVSALLGLGFAIVLARLHIRPTDRTPSRDQSVRAGWRYMRANAAMTALLTAMVTVGLGVDPVITLTPAIADQLGEASSFVGTLASAFGVGAATGFLLLNRAREVIGLPRLAMIGLLCLAAGMAGLALTRSAIGAVAVLFLAGIGMAFAMTSLTTMIHQQVPDNLRGRIMALWGMAFLGSRPIAAGITGWITDLSSVDVALTGITVVLLAGAWLARPSRTSSEPVLSDSIRSPN